MAIIRTERKSLPNFYDGPSYTPRQIGRWVAVTDRDYPWNTIGKALSSSNRDGGTTVDNLMSAADVLAATGMDLEVEKVPVAAVHDDGTVRKHLPQMYVTGVDGPGGFEAFGAVSDRYEVVQPREALAFFDEVVGAVDGAHYSAAWQMREKSMMGITIELPDEIVVDPDGANDRIGMHILGWNSFDGTTGLAGAMDTTRFWCMNQLAPAMRSAKRSFSLRHTRRVRDRAVDAANLLGVTYNYAEALDELANGLHQKSMTDAKFQKFLERVPAFALDTDASDTVKARVEARRNEALQAWEAPHNENIRGTRWGALNVVAEYIEWGRNVRGSSRTGTTAERQRAIGTLVHPTVAGTVTQATEVLQAMRN